MKQNLNIQLLYSLIELTLEKIIIRNRFEVEGEGLV